MSAIRPYLRRIMAQGGTEWPRQYPKHVSQKRHPRHPRERSGNHGNGSAAVIKKLEERGWVRDRYAPELWNHQSLGRWCDWETAARLEGL